ncbi:MAG: FIST C-terminal domain-containing protein [Chitinispirillales bacterium]|jgi:hypothetical protein|nr:FIST C-terminal domain-containing protein [Chitinispirillales bacterium]
MIKSYTVSVTEVDDGEEAVRLATGKIASLPLLKNTVGLVTAHPEFVASGVAGVVAKALPFPTVGMTSISHCAGGAAETYMLSVLILTSEDCEFAHAVSGAIPEESAPEAAARKCCEEALKCYEEARGRLNGEPKLAIIYAPYHHDPHYYEYIAAISKVNERLPLFGGVCNDDRQSLLPRTNARVFHCGEEHEDRLALLLVSGDVSPKFYVDSVTDEAMIMPRVGVITKTAGNKLLQVNNVNAASFFRSIGFLAADGPSATHEGLLSSLFVLHIDNGDGTSGTSITHIPIQVDDDGIRCGGGLVEGAGISVAFNTKESVIETARRTIAKIKKENAGGTAIIHTCLGRRYGLLGEPMAELSLINDSLKEGFNYAAAYATGEICPTGVREGRAFNQDHSQTIVACVF